MMRQQTVTVNLHSPRVQRVERLDDINGEKLVISLGNGEYHGHVDVFVTDAQWTALVAAVALFRVNESHER